MERLCNVLGRPRSLHRHGGYLELGNTWWQVLHILGRWSHSLLRVHFNCQSCPGARLKQFVRMGRALCVRPGHVVLLDSLYWHDFLHKGRHCLLFRWVLQQLDSMAGLCATCFLALRGEQGDWGLWFAQKYVPPASLYAGTVLEEARQWLIKLDKRYARHFNDYKEALIALFWAIKRRDGGRRISSAVLPARLPPCIRQFEQTFD